MRYVDGNICVDGNISVDGNIGVGGNIGVDGNTGVDGSIRVDGNICADGNIGVGGNIDDQTSNYENTHLQKARHFLFYISNIYRTKQGMCYKMCLKYETTNTSRVDW